MIQVSKGFIACPTCAGEGFTETPGGSALAKCETCRGKAVVPEGTPRSAAPVKVGGKVWRIGVAHFGKVDFDLIRRFLTEKVTGRERIGHRPGMAYDALVIFWDLKARGAAALMQEAQALGKPVRLYVPGFGFNFPLDLVSVTAREPQPATDAPRVLKLSPGNTAKAA